MKIKNSNGEVREHPVYGNVSGLKIQSVELDAKDINRLRGETPAVVKEWLLRMASAMPGGNA